MRADSNASDSIKSFCHRYKIQRISMAMMPGIVDSERVCNVIVEFGDDSRVEFKLLGEQSGIGDCISRLASDGSIEALPTNAEANHADLIQQFFSVIDGRMSRIQHEQAIQGITFLHNTFRINNKSVFTVVDDNEGRLTVEMHRGKERQTAVLLASSLLDGLYDGTIRSVS